MHAHISEDTIQLVTEGIADQVFMRKIWLRGLSAMSYAQESPWGERLVNPASIELVLNPEEGEENENSAG